MADKKAITESSIARMAGNIAAGIVSSSQVSLDDYSLLRVAERSVTLARLIALELESPAPGTKEEGA